MDFPSFSLLGKTALVTGATKGIGRHLAVALAHAGADVVVSGRDLDELIDVAGAVEGQGRRVVAVSADLALPEEVQRLGHQALSAWGRIDVLVNNAGVSFPEPALEQKLEAWDRTLAVNLRAPFLLSQILARSMVEHGGGRIINIGSQSGEVGLQNHAAYCASKGGLHNLTRALAVEWGPYNITVNAVAPTVIMTPMGKMAWSDPVKAKGMLDQIPLGRFGGENDVAGAVLFLASPAGDLVNGQIIAVDGGFTAR